MLDIDIQSKNDIQEVIDKENLEITRQLKTALNEVQQIQVTLENMSKKKIKLVKHNDLWSAEIYGMPESKTRQFKPTATEALAELVRSKPSFFGIAKITEIS